MQIQEAAVTVARSKFLVAKSWAEADCREDFFQVIGGMEFDFDLFSCLVSRGQTRVESGRYRSFVGQNAA